MRVKVIFSTPAIELSVNGTEDYIIRYSIDLVPETYSSWAVQWHVTVVFIRKECHLPTISSSNWTPETSVIFYTWLFIIRMFSILKFWWKKCDCENFISKIYQYLFIYLLQIYLSQLSECKLWWSQAPPDQEERKGWRKFSQLSPCAIWPWQARQSSVG